MRNKSLDSEESSASSSPPLLSGRYSLKSRSFSLGEVLFLYDILHASLIAEDRYHNEAVQDLIHDAMELLEKKLHDESN